MLVSRKLHSSSSEINIQKGDQLLLIYLYKELCDTVFFLLILNPVPLVIFDMTEREM